VVFSRTLESTGDRVVVVGDIAGELAALAATPGLIDEYLLVVHPAVIGVGPQLFEQVPTDLALRLVEAKVFDAEAVVLRYAVAPP
jgi:dihydrofolate reductase